MSLLLPAGHRGPAEHDRRAQIISAAYEHFRHYGYEKTTVADLAKAIGLSKAYIYKFFDSKQAIGEEVCSFCLGKIAARASEISAEKRPAADRLRRIFRELAWQSADLLFHDRKVHDLAATSCQENWGSTIRHEAALTAILKSVIQDGREAGEFERKTPLDETARAILLALEPFRHPMLLQTKLDTLQDDATLVANLVLRSLTP